MAARLLIVLIVINQSLSAGQVNQSNVEYKNGIYSLSFDVEIETDLEIVRTLVTDFANIDQLSDLVVESDIISAPDDISKRRLMVARACVLFFCREMKMVEEIGEQKKDVIVATVVPELSDFKSGTTIWRLTEMPDRHSRIEFSSELKPDFWIPPIIGPIMVKHRLLREAMTIINNIEALSRND